MPNQLMQRPGPRGRPLISYPLGQQGIRVRRRTPGADYVNTVVVPVCIGGLIDLLFRDNHLLVFSWVTWVGLAEPLATIRWELADVRIPSIILFSLPDALWVFATTSWMLLIWRQHDRRLTIPWVYAGLVLGVSGELGQATGLVPGTFDWLDFSLSVLAFLASLVLLEVRPHELPQARVFGIRHRDHGGSCSR